MEFPGVDRHARLLVADVLQTQVAPAARYLTNFQPRHPTVRGVKQQMQPGRRSHQKRHRTEQQHDKDQHPEAYFLP
jgi:hypothetical protein